MRGRCEVHQLALGPRGCLVCRREAEAARAAPNVNRSPSAAVASSSAETGAAPEPAAVPATALESTAPRRISVQLPGSLLILPLAAAGFYFFAFLAGNDAPAPGALPASAQATAARPAGDEQPATVVESSSRTKSFQPVMIEEPSARKRRPLGDSEAESLAPAAARPVDTQRRTAQRRDNEKHQLAELRDRVDVIVYSTSWCPACRKLRGYLARRGILATEYDIDRNSAAKARQRQLNPRGSVPTLDIEGQVLVGFDSEALEEAIDRAARARLERL